MRVANLNGRSTLVLDEGTVDIAMASNNRFPSDMADLLAQLDELESWYSMTSPQPERRWSPEEVARDERLGPVSPRPRQVFAIGLNYRTHASEMGLVLPEKPMVFTKFASSISGANSSFPIVSPRTDFEAELVVVVGRGGRNISVDHALSSVAGYCVGQDLSDRELQLVGNPAQFSLGKSYENFSPIGPWLTTSGDVNDPNQLKISCSLNGAVMQDANTSDMVFSVAQLVSYLSSVVELLPGDILFTGSPDGVGQGRTPPVFLKKGDQLITSIQGLGSLCNVAM